MNKILEISNLETGYGKKQVLFGLSLDVKQGEIANCLEHSGFTGAIGAEQAERGQGSVAVAFLALAAVYFSQAPRSDAEQPVRRFSFVPPPGLNTDPITAGLAILDTMRQAGILPPRRALDSPCV